MREILMIMEPRCESSGTTIINEMDEFLEVTFFIHGSYKIGYSLNNKKIYVLPFSCVRKGNAIGAYGCTFNKRAVIIYTCVKQCRGHFIRKSAWHGLLNKLDPILVKSIKKGLSDDYHTNQLSIHVFSKQGMQNHTHIYIYIYIYKYIYIYICEHVSSTHDPPPNF